MVSGAPDVGEVARTVTISCATCRKLRDAVISEEPWKEPAAPMPARVRCPGSRTRDHVTELWRDPGPCPRCAETMVRGELSVLWD